MPKCNWATRAVIRSCTGAASRSCFSQVLIASSSRSHRLEVRNMWSPQSLHPPTKMPSVCSLDCPQVPPWRRSRWACRSCPSGRHASWPSFVRTCPPAHRLGHRRARHHLWLQNPPCSPLRRSHARHHLPCGQCSPHRRHGGHSATKRATLVPQHFRSRHSPAAGPSCSFPCASSSSFATLVAVGSSGAAGRVTRRHGMRARSVTRPSRRLAQVVSRRRSGRRWDSTASKPCERSALEARLLQKEPLAAALAA